jgi:nitroimidazol reductase NimA-like FMN-containing flavoprotein (pyridoxamine 5'-phosphate oxidase superfamily)
VVGGQPGDLGRRVRYWRERVGFSREETGARAGVSVEYLAYLETEPTSVPSARTVACIARAFGIPAIELLGGNADRVQGDGLPSRWPSLVTLDADRSWELLGPKGVGRIVFDSDEGPIALPVNYAISGCDIYFRTGEGTVISRIQPGAPVSLEADRIDDAMSAGWSVVVRGTCEHLSSPAEVREGDGVQIEAWAGGRRQHSMRLRTRSITGRAIERIL